MEPRKEMRKITFKSLNYSDCELAILSKSLQFGSKPEGNYEMQIFPTPTNKQQTLYLLTLVTIN